MGKDRSYIKRRRVPRRSFTRKVGLLVRGVYYISQAYEIGEGGMLFSSEKPLEKGTRVLISFQIDGLKHVIVRATIRYVLDPNDECDQIRYGAQFDTIDFSAKRLIRNYVASKSEGEDIISEKYI